MKRNQLRNEIRFSVAAFSAVSACITFSAYWQGRQIMERKMAAEKIMNLYFQKNGYENIGSFQFETISFIRGDMLVGVRDLPPAEGTQCVDLQWTVNVLTHQVYKWQSYKRESACLTKTEAHPKKKKALAI